jgi:hypothetical protein
MFGERRKHQRNPINRTAHIQLDTGGMQECTITDISDSGARLFVNAGEIPSRFDLLLFGTGWNRRECRIAWRNGGEIGIEFVAPTRNDLIEEIRQEARKIFSAGTQDIAPGG